MYLIRAELNDYDYQVRAALADCQAMHRLVTSMFATNRLDSSILYRVNPAPGKHMLYLYAAKPVEGEAAVKYKVAQKDISAVLGKMTEGQLLSFDLVASPSKDIQNGGKNSRRRLIRDPEGRLAWLARKAEQNGFRILNANELEQIHVTGKHRKDNGGEMHLGAVHFQGTLAITDADVFREALRKGIGSGKAYGFGMMLLKSL